MKLIIHAKEEQMGAALMLLADNFLDGYEIPELGTDKISVWSVNELGTDDTLYDVVIRANKKSHSAWYHDYREKK